jgi:aspartyl-tRNA(Asn)/glutamyl-tRNA(Gln) amidotransferase subunit B
MIGFNYRPLLPRIHHCQRKFAHQATFARDERWPGYQVVIGIEVHAQIKARQKLFSGSYLSVNRLIPHSYVPAFCKEERTSVNETPNTRVSLFDDAFPGTLPVRDNPISLM